MKDSVELVVALLQRNLGVGVDGSAKDYVLLAGTVWGVAMTLLSARLWVLRKMGYRDALPDELRHAVSIITEDAKKQLSDVKNGLVDTHASLVGVVNQMGRATHEKIDLLKAAFTSKSMEVDGVQSELDDNSKPSARRHVVENVKASVIERWLDGFYMFRSDDDPNCYMFYGINGDGHEIKILLLTPYREAMEVDGRLPFALDVWVQNRKQLNVEWSMSGESILRIYKKGSWSEDIASWNLKPVAFARGAA